MDYQNVRDAAERYERKLKTGYFKKYLPPNDGNIEPVELNERSIEALVEGWWHHGNIEKQEVLGRGSDARDPHDGADRDSVDRDKRSAHRFGLDGCSFNSGAIRDPVIFDKHSNGPAGGHGMSGAKEGDTVYIKAVVIKAPEGDRTLYRLETAYERSVVWCIPEEIRRIEDGNDEGCTR